MQRRPRQVNITTGHTSAQILSKDHEKDKSSAQTPTASSERVRPGAAGTTVQFYHASVTVKPVVHFWLDRLQLLLRPNDSMTYPDLPAAGAG